MQNLQTDTTLSATGVTTEILQQRKKTGIGSRLEKYARYTYRITGLEISLFCSLNSLLKSGSTLIDIIHLARTMY